METVSNHTNIPAADVEGGGRISEAVGVYTVDMNLWTAVLRELAMRTESDLEALAGRYRRNDGRVVEERE